MNQPVPGTGDEHDDSLDIAVVGMAGRFPGARDVGEFWSNLKAGVCSDTRFSDEELAARGVPADVRGHEDFVAAGYLLEDSEKFDAAFFGYSPREAEIMDPQHRVLLECAWSALESSGHAPDRFDGPIGVYAGAGNNTYLLFNVATQPDAERLLGDKQTVIGNRSDFVSSRISYKLGLRGPSVNVQSACSTSLVAVAEACQSLLAFQCDMALAGGVAVDPTRRDGYLFRQDGILSPDGYCRTFDARARGTVGGEGAGMVVLKRLGDALADDDHVHAVIKGTALNNDGSRRAGFSAPGAATQAEVIATALANADVDPGSIGYVELHGTATNLGDPIEFSALTSAFAGLPAHGCALGSVKSNIGHLDSAAGVAGLVKTVLAVEHGQIPPSLHFEEPNPRLGMDGSPFYVNTRLRDWPEGDGPRRAGVSSFGLGGTNAHVVLEQAPPRPRPEEPSEPGREELLVLSARSPEALESATDRLQEHLRAHPGTDLRDMAFTLRQRKAFPHRRMVVCSSTEEALGALDARDDGRLLSALAPESAHRPVGFVFTGFGSQYPGMARGLYAREPVFAEAVDECAALLEPLLGQDVREPMFAGDDAAAPPSPDFRRMLEQPARGRAPVDRPLLGYPAVFALEYALVRLWDSWGVAPEAMIGHSLGEYVAACTAGVFSLPDALRLVVERARLIEQQPEGAMLAVPLSEEEALRHTGDEVGLAAVNGPRNCVLSGTVEGIEKAAADLEQAGTPGRRLNTRFAFHSPAMDAVVEPYARLVRSMELHPPERPFVSNTTGTWITGEQAVDPDYWARHMRRTVRFSDGLRTLWSVPDIVVAEVGPAPTLTPDVLRHPAAAATDRVVVPSLPNTFLGGSDRAAMLGAAGRLWLAGRELPSPPRGSARRVPLPAYPFERRRYWLEPGRRGGTRDRSVQERVGSPDDWFHAPSWRRLPPAPAADAGRLAAQRWLVFADDTGLGAALAERLAHTGAAVRTVRAGGGWGRDREGSYVLDPARPEHFARLAESLRAEGAVPERVVHCWGVGADAERAVDPAQVQDLLDRAFTSLVHWTQACADELMAGPQRWDVVSSEVHPVLGDEPLCPPKAAVQGVCKVAVQEYPSLECVHLDVRTDGPAGPPGLVDRLLDHLAHPPQEPVLALRGRHLWAQGYEPVELRGGTAPPVRRDGVYLVTGGLGKIGLLMAGALAEQERVHLVLLGRRGLPPREEWDDPALPGPTASAVRAVRGIEELGSTVTVVAADVGDLAAVRAVRERVSRELGPVNGILHCAGTTGQDAHRTITELGPQECAWHFGPKLHGARVLHEVFAGQRLDFAVISSSVASILGGLGFAAYAAANAALDAFAQRHHGPEQPWTSVNWEAWLFAREEGRARTDLGAAVRELALAPEEGRQVFDRLLRSAPLPQVAVSTGDLAARVRLWADPVADAPAPVRLHERPQLRNPYVAPAGAMEERIARIWQELLGVESVGVHDNFFELGGSSLLGLQVVHRLRQELAVAVPLTIVYEGPTVRTLGELVDGRGEER
ncbi:SDR family NAD(P)-dependent oxidoreductase [Nocardiopsis sp. NPDC101807]|uniref:type I polyketide synthase n=1 Tax=Nocardiopsis sp. NPDC101807 TaxID=3364339 RepID=UPI003826AC8A